MKSNVGFCGEEKPEYPREKPLRVEYRTNKLSPHMMLGWESNPGHIGGRWGLSPQCQPCSLLCYTTIPPRGFNRSSQPANFADYFPNYCAYFLTLHFSPVKYLKPPTSEFIETPWHLQPHIHLKVRALRIQLSNGLLVKLFVCEL